MDTCVASLLFFPPLFLFVFLTQGDLFSVLRILGPKILFAFLFFSQVYCLICRLFCFGTFGEFLAKRKLSRFREDVQEVHPFHLFWRFLLSCLTGVIVLPLLSFIFRKDFMAFLTGLRFQKT